MGTLSDIKSELKRGFHQIVYLMRVLVLFAALGFVIWNYNGDVYVAGALVLCAFGVFASGIAPGLIPKLVQYMTLTPFVMGILIPTWRLGEALLSWERRPVITAAVTLGGYAVAVLMLMKLPGRMRDPFEKWLPDGAVPPAQARSRKERGRARQQAAATGSYYNPARQTTATGKASAPSYNPYGGGHYPGASNPRPATSGSYSAAPHKSSADDSKGKSRGFRFGFGRNKTEKASASRQEESSRTGKSGSDQYEKSQGRRSGQAAASRYEQPTTRTYQTTYYSATGQPDRAQPASKKQPSRPERHAPRPVNPFYYPEEMEDDEEDEMDALWDIKSSNEDLMAKIRARRNKQS